jgi:hypothetical protein
VNGLGIISFVGTSGSAVVLSRVTVSGVRILATTNGAISVGGTLGYLSISGCTFSSIGSGLNGGALFLNVTEFENEDNTFIEDSNFGSCSAVNGGAIHIALGPIRLFDVNFTANVATTAGNDIYYNSTASQTFYTSTTFSLCCSFS